MGYVDVNMDGIKNGSIECYDKEAYTNALRMFFSSYRHEVLRKPYIGGDVVQLLSKPMSDVTIDDFRKAISDALDKYFDNKIVIEKFFITPYYTERYYYIQLTIITEDLRDTVTIEEKLKYLG